MSCATRAPGRRAPRACDAPVRGRARVARLGYAGDVVGLANPGVFAIGDTLYEGAPWRSNDSVVRAGTLCSYGVSILRIQIVRKRHRATARGGPCSFLSVDSARTEPVLAVVGELQFEVAKYRLESEYGVKTAFAYLPFSLARRVAGDREAIARAQFPTNAKLLETGTASRSVFESEWSVRLAANGTRLTFEPFFAQPGKETVTS